MSEKSFYNKIRSQRHNADGLHLNRDGRQGATAGWPVRLALVPSQGWTPPSPDL